MNEVAVLMGALAEEVEYVATHGRDLKVHHESALASAIAHGFRRAFLELGLAGFAVVEGYYGHAKKDFKRRSPRLPRTDVYLSWPHNERFIEIKWARAQTGRRARVKDQAWAAAADLGKLLHLTEAEDGAHSQGKRVFAQVIRTEDTREQVESRLQTAWPALPPSEDLKTHAANAWNERRFRLLPGDVAPSDFNDHWDAAVYLMSVMRKLANYTQGRVTWRWIPGPTAQGGFVVIYGRF